MKVCIAEKPSVAKDIANILGATTKKDGYYEGNGYQVTWTFGHLCTLKSPEEYSPDWKRWNLSTLPMIPPRFGIKVIDDAGIKKQFSTVQKLFLAADEIINCGDAGQEGELIQRYVLQKSGTKAPVKRLWISSLTDESIRDGFAKLQEGSKYDNLYYAGLSRAVGDWLLGMNCSRLFTLKYGNNKRVYSIGRVQTPTLAMIVNRCNEIENFKPEPYWVLSTIYRGTVFTATSGQFKTQEDGESAFATIEGKPFKVTSVEKKNGTEAPPQLYDLTTLQVECNKKFGMTAEQTLQTVQSLYEKKFTTYPRVDTRYLTNDMYDECPKILAGLPLYSAFTDVLSGKKLEKSKKVFDNSKVTDHHAIIPTGNRATHLAGNESRVYDLIARRFISVFYPVCKFAQTVVLGEVDGTEFKVTGKTVLDEGWKVLYATDKKEDSEEKTLPVFKKGESGTHTPTLAEKQTTPPKYYTEATLLRAMETAGKQVDDEELRSAMKENGIGRPSSRASIIENLFKKGYIERDKKNIKATAVGSTLVGLIKDDLLKSPELTGQWEKKLRDIETGKFTAVQFMNELKEQLNTTIKTVLSDNTKVTIVEDTPKKPIKKSKKK